MNPSDFSHDPTVVGPTAGHPTDAAPDLDHSRVPSREISCRHTKAPSGYLAWHEWAEKKAKTHDQHRCPSCGLWAIWRKR